MIAVNSPSYRECGTRAAIASCGHMLHYRCMRSLMDSHNETPVGQLESIFCPVCRRLENGIVPILAHVLINASWRDRMVMSPSWSPSGKGKSDLQACMSAMEEEDSVRKWWYENRNSELFEEAEKENGKKMIDSLGLFTVNEMNGLVGYYCAYYLSVMITISIICVFYFIEHMIGTFTLLLLIRSFAHSLVSLQQCSLFVHCTHGISHTCFSRYSGYSIHALRLPLAAVLPDECTHPEQV